jgi:hypothetical protein
MLAVRNCIITADLMRCFIRLFCRLYKLIIHKQIMHFSLEALKEINFNKFSVWCIIFLQLIKRDEYCINGKKKVPVEAGKNRTKYHASDSRLYKMK